MSEEASIMVDTTVCCMMYEILREMKDGGALEGVAKKLDAVLETPAYATMFEHYNRSWRPNHLPKDVFKRMILSLAFPEQYTRGENRRADHMLEKWTSSYNDLARYEETLENLRGTDLHGLIRTAVEEARGWLPPEMEIGGFDLYVNPNGSSPGYKIGGAQGYDFFQLPDRIEDLEEILAHECHHSGLEIPTPEFGEPSDAVAFDFLKMFVGEGTANKFIDNVPGGCVPPIRPDKEFRYPDEEAMALWREAWEEHTASEESLFERMAETLRRAYRGELTNEGLQGEKRDFWLSGAVAPAYFLGSEIFGAIYHAFGREGSFEAMRDPRKILSMYNAAVKKEGRLLSRCPLVPEEIAERPSSEGS